jgi:hypothetical protein
VLDFFRKPIFIIILALALIVAGVWAYVSNSNKQKEQTEKQEETTEELSTGKISNLTNIEPTALSENVDSQLSIADGKAAEADSKLQLGAIEVILPETLDVNSGDSYYIYTSVSDTIYNWVISVSNSDNRFVRSKTVKSDYIGNVSKINRTYLKNNYVTALQIAEKNGGKEFRESNTISEVRLTLKNTSTKLWLYWFVKYVSSSEIKEYQIDASTGALATE